VKSIFSSEVFNPGRFVPFRLAQAAAPAPEGAFNIVGDILDTIGVSEEDINKLFDKIPTSAVGSYKAKLEACKAKGVATPEGAACLYALYQEMKAASDAPKAPAPPPPPPPASTFPVLPVAIGGLVLAGLVIFLATRKG
jgi:hypothetical protein